MIIKVKFKNLKNDSLFDFEQTFFVKQSKKTAKALNDGKIYQFLGKEIVEADSERIKPWWKL